MPERFRIKVEAWVVQFLPAFLRSSSKDCTADSKCGQDSERSCCGNDKDDSDAKLADSSKEEKKEK